MDLFFSFCFIGSPFMVGRILGMIMDSTVVNIIFILGILLSIDDYLDSRKRWKYWSCFLIPIIQIGFLWGIGFWGWKIERSKMFRFPYRWTPKTILKNLDYAFWDIYLGIKNTIKYLPVIWFDRDFDWEYLARLMEF